MPIYQYRCRACGFEKELLRSIDESIPPQLECRVCGMSAKRVFSFGWQPFEIEINSPNVGKHGSKRSYNTARDRLAEEHSNRVGMDVQLESFDARDPDADPTKPLR